MMKIIKIIFSKDFWNTVKDLNRSFFHGISFPLTLIAFLIMQFVFYKGRLNFSIKKLTKLDYLTAIVILVFLIWLIVNSHVLQFIKVKDITPFDFLIYGGFLTLFLSNLVIEIVGLKGVTKISLPMISLYLCAGLFELIFGRICIITNSRSNINEQENSNEQLYELKDLAQGKIPHQNQGPILVDERAANYDLLNRGNIVRLLSNAITHYSPNHSYVIGLVGDWGSGKTTIVNLVKKRFYEEHTKYKSLKFMHAPNNKGQDFDLWLYGSKQAIIKGLYDTFLSNMGVKYNSVLNDKFINGVSQVVAGVPKVGGIVSALLSSNTGSYSDVLALKEKLSKYIKSTRKNYILFVENLDRASNQQIILLLKLISSVFDLPNVTYVLLYSEKRLKGILQGTDSADTSYADKVVNLEIKMPADFEKNICKVWLQNLLLTYGEDKIYNYDYVLDTIVDNLIDIRELKRIINSVFPILTIRNTIRLNLPQVLAIQYIYFSDKNLYEKIKNHEDDFLFEDRYVQYNQKLDISNKNKDYFMKVSKDYKQYISLLSNLFPKFRSFQQKNNYILSYNGIRNDLKETLISTRRYFKNYFELAENDHVKINYAVRYFINEINSKGKIKKAWNKIIMNSEINPELLVSELGMFTDSKDIPSSEVREKLSEIMFNEIDPQIIQNPKIDTFRVRYIIADMIGEVDKKNFEKFKRAINHKYNMLDVVESMSNYMSIKLGGRTDEFMKNISRMKSLCNEMLNNVLKSRINFYYSHSYIDNDMSIFHKYWGKNSLRPN